MFLVQLMEAVLLLTVLLYITQYNRCLISTFKKGSWKLSSPAIQQAWILPLQYCPDHTQAKQISDRGGGQRERNQVSSSGVRTGNTKVSRLRTEDTSKVGAIPYLGQFSHNGYGYNAFILICGMGWELLKWFRHYRLVGTYRLVPVNFQGLSLEL